MSDRLNTTVDRDLNTPGAYVSRYDSLYEVATRRSDNFVADADKETKKKKDDLIASINAEINRRKTAFNIV